MCASLPTFVLCLTVCVSFQVLPRRGVLRRALGLMRRTALVWRRMMKPDMGEIQRMSPTCVKGEDSAPGGHPEAENVPPPGTPALSNGEEVAAVAARLGMSPLKVSVANEGRRASPLYKGASQPSSATRTLPPTSAARALPPGPAACSLRKPMLILRRLDPKQMWRKSDIEEMGLNDACAKRIRRELARCKRNCRRRYLRKVGRMSLKKAPRTTTVQPPQTTRRRRRRVAAKEAASGSPPLEEPAAAAAAAAAGELLMLLLLLLTVVTCLEPLAALSCR
ncbi:hypothetical protein E2C01_094855 [Portunus trituberculatus]|uniref:Uncharacterized protein n=1 Tax=Portunus trituberculatus TaxID=210409 RepID=A0A5B7JTL1_PORTR|nr:hypothetical protein [Portunus trituberculatus]